MNKNTGRKLASLAMVLVFSGSVIAQEPITPIEPIKEINLATAVLPPSTDTTPRPTPFE